METKPLNEEKLYSFFDVTRDKKILRRRNNGHFHDWSSIPKEFTLQDLDNNKLFPQNKRDKIASLKRGTVFIITQLCGWSGASGTAEYLAVKRIDEDNSDTASLRKEISELEKKSVKLKKEIDLKAGDLIKDKSKTDTLLRKLKDKLEKIYTKK